MSVLEQVFGGDPPATLDDAWRAVGANGEPATAALMAQEIHLANQAAHAGRPFYTWAYNNIIGGDCTSMFRQVYMASNRAATNEYGRAVVMDHQFDPDGGVGFQTGQGLRIAIGTAMHDTPINFGDPVGFQSYPASSTVVTYTSAFGFSTQPAEMIIGALTTNNPQPRAGTIWQVPLQMVPSTKGSAIGSANVQSKGDIIGVRSTGDEQLTSLSDSIRDTWYHQRPQCGWSAPQPGTAFNFIDFTTSKTNFRYIFDQSRGSGGAAFSATGPAMTLPLANAAAGLLTQLRVHVFVYAAMSGTTDTGSIAVANKDSGGTMALSPTVLTNGPTISGTTFQWYPSLSTWSPSTGAYFPGYAGGAFDRVALCAKSSGSTDSVRIAAFTLVVAPATT